MGSIRVLALFGAIGLGVYAWSASHPHRNAAVAGAAGFVHTAMPEGAQADTVLILAPVNCPSTAAKRAEALSRRLTEMNIPNVRSNHAALRQEGRGSTERKDEIAQAADVLNGEIPAVFVNGMGKSNPTADDVAAVYQLTAHRN